MKNNNLNVDKLENRICLDAAPIMGPEAPECDSCPDPIVLERPMGPAIPEGFNYHKPEKLVRNFPTQVVDGPVEPDGADQQSPPLEQPYAVERLPLSVLSIPNDDGGDLGQGHVQGI